jgi:hypothetical protein
MGLHAVIIVIVPTFAALCDWQVHRALSGNDLSWAYVFEWPFFAGYAIYMWWRFVHEDPVATGTAATGQSSPPPATTPPASADEDAELAAYNRYLAELAARDTPKRWR